MPVYGRLNVVTVKHLFCALFELPTASLRTKNSCSFRKEAQEVLEEEVRESVNSENTNSLGTFLRMLPFHVVLRSQPDCCIPAPDG
ncbi:hypothetical protein V1477_006776 [Vespula maculifrons]|uniref:Uncharacterized protein n=1 Tax=Vespula maculifrons TaxID=7453 RepID=A0ABD2CGM7_VESMC